MRAHRNVMLASAVAVGVVLAGCGGSDTSAGDGGTASAEGRPPARAGGADRRSSPTTSASPRPATRTPSTTAPSTSTARAPATPPAAASTARPAPVPPAGTTTPPSTSAPRGGEPRFACPRGGMDEVTALQDSFEQGHQPWRASPDMVAAACAFGTVGTSVEPAGANRYRVTDDATGETALVEVAQPLGPGTVWVAVAVSPA